MIELIKIVRDKAKSDILYAQARVSVCEELLEMAEQKDSETAQVSLDDIPTITAEESVVVGEENLNESVFTEFNMGV